ncbi:MAG: ZIP family metal transporter [Burkholderiaceae bacterium]
MSSPSPIKMHPDPDEPLHPARGRWRAALPLLVGLAVVFTGLSVTIGSAWQTLNALPNLKAAAAFGSVAALATALGVLPMLLTRAPGQRVYDMMLGFGAGVMLAASCFSLLLPALEATEQLGFGRWGSSIVVGLGLLLGAGLLMAMEHFLPHEHFLVEHTHIDRERARRLWLFVFAIVLHNVPEGLAIGVATAGTDMARAAALSTGIAIQDVPEGLVVALALHAAGVSRWQAAAVGAASGLVEPVAALVGAAAIDLSVPLLPWGLAFAAGAMLFVVSHEVIPESHRRGHERYATSGLLIGFVLMMVLDTALG